MRIKEILNQHRRDFTVIYECEHCGHTFQGEGNENVIPRKECPKCGKTARIVFSPLKTKYSDDFVVYKGHPKG